MPRRLIINADDFGLTVGVNRAIEELHRAGVLSSATLMASGQAFPDAVERAKRNPRLGVGCHIVLTDGVPISPPGSIPSLMSADGRTFRSSLGSFLRALLTGKIRETEIQREAREQIVCLQRAGIRVTHVDTHKHTHLFPAVSRAICAAAAETGVGAIRNPFEQAWSLRLNHGGRVRRLQVLLLGRLQPLFARSLAGHGLHLRTTDGTLGISATGELDARTLRDLLVHLPEGTWELVCHPGYDDRELDQVRTRLRRHREVERAALAEVVPGFLRGDASAELIDYGALEEV